MFFHIVLIWNAYNLNSFLKHGKILNIKISVYLHVLHLGRRAASVCSPGQVGMVPVSPFVWSLAISHMPNIIKQLWVHLQSCFKSCQSSSACYWFKNDFQVNTIVKNRVKLYMNENNDNLGSYLDIHAWSSVYRLRCLQHLGMFLPTSFPLVRRYLRCFLPMSAYHSAWKDKQIKG